MPFANEIVGGTKLLIPAIRSPNYVPNVQGWSINKDGTVEFGSGTFRGPVVVIDPATGLALASIGATGIGSFQTVNATNDVIIGTVSVKDSLINRAKVVARFTTAAALPVAPASNVFANIMWTRFNMENLRIYQIQVSSNYAVNNNFTNNQDLRIRAVLTFSDSSTVTLTEKRTAASGGRAEEFTYIANLTSTGFPVGPCTVAIQACGTDTNTWTVNNVNGTGIMVLDVGPDIAQVGGTGNPSGTSQFTKQYVCTASRSYNDAGNPNGAADQDKNMYRSTFPDRTYGNERAYWIFPGATIRTDLTGATVQQARLYMYCIKAEETLGSVGLTFSTLSAVPATYDGATVLGTYSADDIWPVPGWNFLDLLTGAPTGLSRITTDNANSAALKTGLFGLAATGFAGFSDTVGLRAYIEIIYTK